MYRIARTLLLATLLTSAIVPWACSKRGEASRSNTSRAELEPLPPLYAGLGSHTREISTESERAQAYFDQGLRLQYAFNHAEAVRSYRAALEADPTCAMCWWGIALASGNNINAGIDEAGGRLAFEAVNRAMELRDDARTTESQLIEAISRRYGADPLADRALRDSAYARSMERVVEMNPADPDILTLYAAALMNLAPWHYWDGPYANRTPRPGTRRIVSALEDALAIDPEHPGACHYLIHAVEAAFPERALDCAERLASLMPAAGHIVHMPGHIYIRVGRYADAVEANRHAVHEDEEFIADQGQQSVYTGAYYPHNYHFMAFAATMAGMRDEALQAARTVSTRVPLEVARAVPFIQNAIVLPQLTLLTFGAWEAVLREPAPDSSLELASTVHLYARGTALAASGRMDEARSYLGRLRNAARAATEAAGGDESASPVLSIAAHALAAEIALRALQPAVAVERFRLAAQIEDGMLYEEPPLWYYPIRHSLGRALLEAGDAQGAETVYREDLARFPENGWSLFGLAESLEAQGRTDEADAVRARFEKAWVHADVELSASRF